MKRHPALHDVSRDHHAALVHARRLAGQDSRIDAGTARRRFLRYYESILRHHFDEEERALAPVLPAALRRRLLADHAAIRALADGLREASPAHQKELARRILGHVRFEEGEAFPLLQQTLTAAQWDAVAQTASALRRDARPDSIGPNAAEPCYL